MITTENIGRCPRCHRFLVAEEIANHECKIKPERWVEEIFLSGITDSSDNEDGDAVRVGFGLDGRYYRFVVCKHKPPHSLKSRLVTAIKRPEDETEPDPRLCCIYETPVFSVLAVAFRDTVLVVK